MAEFSKLVITDTGRALLAKMIAGSGNIRFTKVSTSSTAYEEAQLQGLAFLAGEKQTSLISKVTRTNETAIEVEAAFTNTDLTEGYHMRALGLYAVDPDEGEILYAVATELSGCCYMPAYNGVTLSGILLTLVTTVGNAESVSLEVTPAGIATLKDVQTVQADIQTVKAQLGEHTVGSDVPENAIFSNMVGATETAAGQAGYVPAPAAGAQEKYLRGDGTWQPAMETLADIRANTQGGYAAGALALKEALGTVLEQTLVAGDTTLTFTNDAITDDSMIDVYTDPFCNGLTSAAQDGNTLTLTFDARENDVQVKVKVG
ncbi:MAG: hypothetical protein HDQ98_03395 [Lachnospiraceae bacterium]|nr:hypothetical protein [Lachnospiraceae bacterium]